MTVINTSYTSLEDAWGSNFDLEHNNKKQKKKKSKPDPLCDLYAKRYRKAKKPYSSKYEYVDKYRSYNKERDEANYFGYGDNNEFTKIVNPERQKTSFLTLDDELLDEQCIDVNNIPKKKTNKKKKKVHFDLKPEDEDDVYLQKAVNEESEFHFDDIVNTNQKSFEKIYSNVYEESDDEIDEEIYEESEDSPLIEEELKRSTYINSLRENNINNTFVDERQYLDILIYILSGIILIFMMEQFIQIGMRLKSSY